MLSKLFTKTLRSTLSRSSLPKKQLQFTLYKSVSTAETAKVDKGKQKLVKAIARQIKFEQENYKPDENAKAFLENSGYSLRDEEGETMVELIKKIGNVTIQIYFEPRAPLTHDEGEEIGDEDVQKNIQRIQPEKEGEAEPEPESQYPEQNFSNFTVYIIQTNGKALAFECSSFDKEINVNYLSLITDVQAHKNRSSSLQRNSYHADMSLIDEKLQIAALEYLRSFGIDENVASFVENYSLDKDQRMHIKWLKEVNEFIERPLE